MSATATAAMLEPEVEVVAKPQRRRFTAEYKRKIVRAADGCRTPGAVGALLRRLYSSHLAMWRAARDRGELARPTKKRGPRPRPRDPRDKVIANQTRELARWNLSAPRIPNYILLPLK